MRSWYVSHCRLTINESSGESAHMHVTFNSHSQRRDIYYVKTQAKIVVKVRKSAKIRNRNNQAPHLIQDTKGKVTKSQLDITNESQEVSPFPAGKHKALINRRARMHNKNKTKIA